MRGLFGNWTSGEEIKRNLDIFLPITKVLSILEAIISKFCSVGHWIKKKLLSIHISPSKILIPLKYLIGLCFFWLGSESIIDTGAHWRWFFHKWIIRWWGDIALLQCSGGESWSEGFCTQSGETLNPGRHHV